MSLNRLQRRSILEEYCSVGFRFFRAIYENMLAPKAHMCESSREVCSDGGDDSADELKMIWNLIRDVMCRLGIRGCS